MNRGSRGIFTTKAQPFSKWWAQFRAEVIVVPMEDPLEPFMTVNDNLLTLRTGYHSRRNTIVVPWMLMLTVLTLYFIYASSYKYDFESHKAQAARMIDFHRDRAPDYKRWILDAQKTGDTEEEAYYQRRLAENEKQIKGYSIYFEQDGDVTLFTHMRALEQLGKLDSFLSTTGFLALMCALSLGMWLLFLLKPQDAEVYFDRNRQIVYSWRHGRVGAASFDKMGILENHLGLNIVLQFENKKQTGYRPMGIVGIDIGKLSFHRESDMTYPLAQILAFMEHGKEAVITGESFTREPAKYFLHKDKKPDNFEQRVEAALAAQDDLVSHYQTNRVKGHAI
ncbi:conserved hypothetical protein [Vibrio jasicida]|uniref:Uncharacterized protein n=1 Tax=Vibrio jasicida TaxID=766224 RepID=A0AAU9QEA5_9VIBR|nr:conserved hypothetical protein [Vibrio jasicida]CAH1568245.1 conserved hypothetical protein [Vibrio jasicida]